MKNLVLLCSGNRFQYLSVIRISHNFSASLTEHFGTRRNDSEPIRESWPLSSYCSHFPGVLVPILYGYLNIFSQVALSNSPIPSLKTNSLELSGFNGARLSEFFLFYICVSFFQRRCSIKMNLTRLIKPIYFGVDTFALFLICPSFN